MAGFDVGTILAVGLGFYMAWAIGANDVANAMGTSVGSRALTLVQAVVIAAVFEFLGAFLVGGHVTKTIQGGILEPSLAAQHPDLIVYGMLASLAGAATWLLAASRMGWPVSTTHSIVGAIAGFGLVALGVEGVEWGRLLPIFASWVISPVFSGVVAYLLFILIRRTILDHANPIAQVQRWGPAYVAAVVVVMGLVTLYKGLKNLNLDFTLGEAVLLTSALAALFAGIAAVLLRRIPIDPEADRDFHYATVERMFAILMAASACAVAFAHGSNDVANAIGPLAAIFNIQETGRVSATSPIPPGLLLIGAVGIVLGLATMGRRVMATVGERITQLTPTRGYAAQFAAAAIIVVASRLALPVSTTHVLVGAVFGVGLARGIGALDYRVVGTIIVSWVVTIPAGAILTMFFYYFFKGLLA